MILKIRFLKKACGLLADGSKIAAQKIGKGSEKYAMHVKGQELPMHEPRGKNSLALAYSLSPTGADHMHNMWDEGLAAEKLGTGWKTMGVYTSVPTTVSGKVSLLSSTNSPICSSGFSTRLMGRRHKDASPVKETCIG